MSNKMSPKELNRLRQRRWRKRHPEEAAAHLLELKAVEAQEEEGRPLCDHDDLGVRIEAHYCGECGGLLTKRGDLDRAQEEWLSRSRSPALDDDGE